ncbi:MAG: GNAT family N-acetyltransferase [Candidatus Roizmanbacteria bacterium]|nr:GNAT family N-acetyltransferase [Candidatus Roizmanbacteria bacterium]
MTKILIRNAEVKDALGIATVHVKMWQKAYKCQVPDAYLNSMSIDERAKVWEEMLRKPKLDTHIFVAESDGILVGWIQGGKNRDTDVESDVGELGGIYVHPHWQGKGVGTKMINFFLEKLRVEGYTKATLWVLGTNLQTRSWYESRGWRAEGKTKIEPREGFELHEVRYTIDL